MDHLYDGRENREHVRVPKKYSLFFHFKDSPDKKSDETFIKDISKGGVCFTTSQHIKPGTRLVFEIGIPYIAPRKLDLEGLVISSKEITAHWVYEIRAEFVSLDEQTIQVLDMVEQSMLKDKKAYGLS